jgi:hypothetical protein
MSQMWQERQLCGKHGKRDDNMAREMTTCQERRQRGNNDVIGQYEKKKILYFSPVWLILSITLRIKRRNVYNMYK